MNAYSLTAILCLSFTLHAQEAEPRSSLILHISLDEGKGVVVKDHSNFQNHGTINGKPTWERGIRGKALRFHGTQTNGFIDVRPSKSLNLTAAHTLCFWLKWDGKGAPWSPLLTKRPVDMVNPDHYSTWVRSDGTFDYRNNSGTVSADRKVPLENEWIFVAVAHDGKDSVTFFVDGKPAGRKKLAKTTSNGGPFVIGSGRHLAGDFGAGAIDEVAIFKRSLTNLEIKALKEMGPTYLSQIK